MQNTSVGGTSEEVLDSSSLTAYAKFLSPSGAVLQEINGDAGFTNQAVKSGLCTVPLEILGQICENLNAVWIYNLSMASRELYHSLNGPGANFIWYAALPKALWRKREKFQDEFELSAWARSAPGSSLLALRHFNGVDLRTCTFTGTQGGYSAILDVNTHNSVLMTPAELSPVSRTSKLDEPDTGTTRSLMDNWDSDVASNNKRLKLSPSAPSLFTRRVDATHYLSADNSPSRSRFSNDADGRQIAPISRRERVLALGGCFRSDFSYKRELLGYIASRERCFICFEKASFHHQTPVSKQRWGMMWCEGCYCGHTIDRKALEALLASDTRQVTNAPDDVPQEATKPQVAIEVNNLFRKAVSKTSERYWAPEVSQMLLRLTGSSLRQLRNLKLQDESNEQFIHPRPKGGVGRAERLIKHQARLLICAAAELLWEGIDLGQYGVFYDNNVRPIAPERTDPLQFAAWRTRFAPTHKLRSFLFPEELLQPCFDGSSSLCPAGEIFPSDPVADLSLADVWTLVHQPTKIAELAEDMLIRLTDFEAQDYNSNGGACTSWLTAANKYHKRRLEKHLDSMISQQDYSVFRFRSKAKKTTLAERLGLFFDMTSSNKINHVSRLEHNTGTDFRPDVELGSHSSPEAWPDDGCHHDDHDHGHAQEQRQQHQHQEYYYQHNNARHADKLHYGKKILFATTKRCPINQLIITKKGVDAMLKHMLESHPAAFWQKDDWYLVG